MEALLAIPAPAAPSYASLDNSVNLRDLIETFRTHSVPFMPGLSPKLFVATPAVTCISAISQPLVQTQDPSQRPIPMVYTKFHNVNKSTTPVLSIRNDRKQDDQIKGPGMAAHAGMYDLVKHRRKHLVRIFPSASARPTEIRSEISLETLKEKTRK